MVGRGASLAVMGVLVLVAGARAVAPGDNGRIAFVRDADIYVMAPDATGLKQLTTDPADDGAPAFSPDAKRIAFQSTRPGFNDVFVMDADGSNVKNLSNLGGDDLDPSWSPGGTRIVFARNDGGNYEIFSMDATDGSDKRNLTNNPAGELNPAYSPDGTRIVFIRNVNGNNFELFAMDTDGSDQRNLTSSVASESGPAFSPGGSRIAYVTDRDGNDEIYSMAFDGTDMRRLTNAAASDTAPAWSPDGTRLLFSRGGDLYSMRASDGSDLQQLTADSATDTGPDWAIAAATATPTPTPTPSPTPTATATVTATATATATARPTPSPTPTATAAPRPTATPTAEPTATPTARPTPVAVITPGTLPSPSPTPAGRPPSTSFVATPTPRPATTPQPPGATPTPTVAAVVPATTPPPPPPSTRAAKGLQPDRSQFVQLVLRPDDLFVSPADLGRSFGLAVLLAALLGFPARLWNMTWKGNRRTLSRWLARFTRFSPRRGALLTSFAGTSVAIAAAIHWFLDPGFPSRRGSGPFALGMVLGIAVIVTLLVTAWRSSVRRTAPDNSLHWHVYPGQILVSILCVSVSRLAHFVPGLIFGMAGDLEPRKPLTLEDNGRATARAGASMLVLALSAWALSIPVGDAAAHADAGFALRTLDATLAVVAVTGMEYLVFMLAPFVFLDGYDLARWRPAIWAALWGTAVLWFSLAVLNPALSHYQGEARASVAWLGGLLAFEAVAAFALWAFFVARTRRATA